MKTTRNIAILAISAILFSCGGSQTTEQQNKCIAPLPAGVSVDSLKDCIVPASFTNNDFNWMGGNLSMTVYNTDLYDAVEVSQMQVGDTIIYAGEPIIISQIDQTEGGVEINGGQVDEGGCCLVAFEGGTYITRGMNDHANFSELGKAQVPLAENFVLIDCGENPTDPSDTLSTNQKLYIENLKDGKSGFSPLNTQVTIENGAITQINRRWIP